MTVPDQTVQRTKRTGSALGGRAASAFGAIAAFAIVLAACGSTQSTPSPSLSSSSSAKARATVQARRPRSSRIGGFVITAMRTYSNEAKGPKLFEQLARISHDGILLDALSRGDLTGAQAEADAQLRSTINHVAHVTRISVIHGSRVLVNATVNSDGVFVVAPAIGSLRSHGRLLGRLLVSIQDVTGFVKLVHRLTGAEVLARGASGHVRTSLGAAAGVRLPTSGRVTIAERGYLVRSFREIAWGGEPLTVWILERA
jgi:hypothetical protein